ncbi:ethyl tert-butyl ether degradation protein EthD [Haloprofundus marisrubri]|uniref:Ethyl tert-butyl ether degradation protein EthD n=1 Tax=Haloprofundus marisrubri TaxID=1514971 RepID=A0A0W1RB51_9EURY|nr:EthD family reductase [Haloprofundus marisrubri]KTG10458.1 ethyl tert-butyl ether degradation protein EthD [Haloprofundus marisrubri]
MIKLVELLVRRDGMTHDEFVDYWLNEHSPIAKEMPGLKKYVTSVPKDPDRTEYDGVLELYFEDSEAMSAAFDSEAGERTLADAEQFLETGAGPRLVLDETIQLDDL